MSPTSWAGPKGLAIMEATCLLDYSLLAAQKPHEINLLVKLKAPKAPETDRKPLNLGLVLDRSGSMAGEKVDQTKEAASLLIRHLDSRDRVSVVTFESGVQTLIPPGPVENKQALIQKVRAIESGGMTNLSGGWLKGIEHVAAGTGEEAIRRILLLTDGLANQGITDHDQLAAIGDSAKRDHGIVTTTLGFGQGFNEDLLTRIARYSGGSHYFIETADSAPEIFAEELGELLKLVAQNLEVKVAMESPVQFMAQWTDFPADAHGNEVTFQLGDVYSEEERALMLQLAVPGIDRMGPVTVAKVAVKFAEIGTAQVTARSISQEVRANIADAGEAEGAEPQSEVLHHLGLQLASKARRDAIREADRGDFEAARRVLDEAAAKLKSMPGDVAAKLQEEIHHILLRAEETTQILYSHGTRKRMMAEAHNISSAKMDKLRRMRKRGRKGPDQDREQ